MTRYIDADALKKAMDGYWGRCQRIRKPRNGETAVFLDVRATVEKQPTIDAEPVRHAKWIEHEWAEESEGLLISNYECSECHTWERNESDYCPKCGARMDAERKDYDKAD